MFYQQAMKPQELLDVLHNTSECFFVVEGHLPERLYQVAIYKYDREYFLLQDPRIFQQTLATDDEEEGDDNEVLPYIEEALESNLFQLVDEGYVRLDLLTLAKMKHAQTVIHYFEFIDLPRD